MDNITENVLIKEMTENDYPQKLFTSATVSAIYQQGVLCPLEPLVLPESASVQIQVISSKYFATRKKQRFNAFQRRLIIIHELLSEIEENLENISEREVLPQILQIDLKQLWYLCQPSHREFCAMLELSAMHLDAENLTIKQVEAFRFGIEIIQQSVITETDVDRCHDFLIDAGLPPSFSFDDATVQSYLDEF